MPRSVRLPPLQPLAPAASRWALRAAALGGLLLLYRETVWGMVRVWAESQTFKHGFAIVPLALWLGFDRRRAVSMTPWRPNSAGAVFTAAAGFLWLVGRAASVSFLEGVALVAMGHALVISLEGPARYRILFFPLAYLFFAVPAGAFLVPLLQPLTAHAVTALLGAAQIPAFLDGNVISVPGAEFRVAEACAGLRFLVAAVALGVFFAGLRLRSLRRRVGFVALCFAVPIAANVLRAFAIVYIGHLSGEAEAVAADHIVYGWGFFAAVMLGLLWFGSRLAKAEECGAGGLDAALIARGGGRAPLGAQTAGGPTRARILIAAGLALVALAIPRVYSAALENVPPAEVVLTPPSAGAGWEALPRGRNPTGWRPIFPRADAELLQVYTREGDSVVLYIAYYRAQRQGAEVVHDLNLPEGGPGWSVTASGSADLPPLGRVDWWRIAGFSGSLHVFSTYWVGGRFTSSRLEAKALQARAALFGGDRRAAAVVLGVRVRGSQKKDRALKLAADFLAGCGPLGRCLDRAGR